MPTNFRSKSSNSFKGKRTGGPRQGFGGQDRGRPDGSRPDGNRQERPKQERSRQDRPKQERPWQDRPKQDRPWQERSKPERVRQEYPEADSDRTENSRREGLDEEFDKLEGRNSVLEALKSGRTINKILVAKGDREGSINYIIALAKENKVVVQDVERAKLDSISTTHAHQGVIAFVSVKDYVEPEEIIRIAQEKGEAPFIIILDEITDAHNLGSILRTADAVGAHGVIIPKRRAVGLSAVVSKASAGAIEYVPVARVTNLAQTIDYLKKQNIWVVGTDSTGDKSFFESDLKGPIALVIGSEGEGIGRLVREKCDFVVNIPMKGSISSLNAAVAGAIVMYEVLKQRNRQ